MIEDSINRPVKTLTLRFPHGATPGECSDIARRAERLVKARVSEGGFDTEGCFGVYMDPVKFREDAMTFVFEYIDDAAARGVE